MLVAFVVAIGTAITTVAMLEEAPQTLTQTVNRVVERTIERVVTGTSTPEKEIVPGPITTVTKEVTVYAKEEDLIVSAVEKNQPRMVTIYMKGGDSAAAAIALGFVVSRDGVIATAEKDLLKQGTMKTSYEVHIGSKIYSANPVTSKATDDAGLTFLKVTDLTATDTIDAVSFGKQTDPKIGQSAIILGGEDGSDMLKSSISKFRYTTASATGSIPALASIDVLPKIPDGNGGGLVVNLDGQAIGIVLYSDTLERYIVLPASRVLELVTSTFSSEKHGAAEGEKKDSAGV